MSDNEDLFEAIDRGVQKGVDPKTLDSDIWERFGQTRAVLVADSTGFSRTTQKKGIVHFLGIITRMRRVGAVEFEKNKAVKWRMEADNMYAQFETVDQAVSAALAIHRSIQAQGIMLDEDDPFGVCIGIGYGWLLEAGKEGMFGDQMNLASKLGEDTAEGGETLLTEEALRQVTDLSQVWVEKRFVHISGVDLPYFSLSQTDDAE